MKWYAYKDLENSDAVKLMACKGDAEAMMKQASPDKVVSGAGTTEDPYVYAATAELIGELAKDEDGKYIMPDSYFRSAWKDDSAGGVEIDQFIDWPYNHLDEDLKPHYAEIIGALKTM